ncbi:hypothetical protein ACJJTC_016841 [Scirpophaga incertulas]
MVWLRNTYIRQRNRDSVQDCRIHSIISHEKNDGYNEVDALGQLTIVENEKKRKYVIVAFEMESMHMWQHIPLSVKTSAGHRGGVARGGTRASRSSLRRRHSAVRFPMRRSTPALVHAVAPYN